MKLKLTDDQRVAKHHFYSLGTDQEGRETLVGLTPRFGITTCC